MSILNPGQWPLCSALLLSFEFLQFSSFQDLKLSHMGYIFRVLFALRFWVVSAVGRFGHESFRPGYFGLILGWVVSAYFDRLFRTDIHPQIFYSINETAHNDKSSVIRCLDTSLCSAAVSKESYIQ